MGAKDRINLNKEFCNNLCNLNKNMSNLSTNIDKLNNDLDDMIKVLSKVSKNVGSGCNTVNFCEDNENNVKISFARTVRYKSEDGELYKTVRECSDLYYIVISGDNVYCEVENNEYNLTPGGLFTIKKYIEHKIRADGDFELMCISAPTF